MTSPLSIRDLSVEYSDGTWAVRDVSLTIPEGQCLALVGESGCGKTTIARAVLGMLPPGTRVSGSIKVAGREVVGASAATLHELRGRVVGYVSQDPYAALNPLMRVGRNIAEAWYAHRMRPPSGAIAQSLERLGVEQSARRSRWWPHQWSGGMLQRATIAAASAHRPPVIVADEPTSALDADLGRVTLDALRSTGTTVLLVSHDMGVVDAHADLLAVCYAGRVIEYGATGGVLNNPRHPYTAGLLKAIPRPGHGLPAPLEGSPPNLRARTPGCLFAPRCPLVREDCHEHVPALVSSVACPVVMAA